MLPRMLTASVAILAISCPALAQLTLKVGDRAPALSVAEWIQGDITGIESGTVHLVEFWATWCGPCRAAIPHLNRLHANHAAQGLVVIGVSDEKAGTVRDFVRRQDPAMTYAVAVDSNDLTKNAWMQAAGRSGIPTTFLVGRDRRVLWIGHPMDKELERILPAVMAGTFDPAIEVPGFPPPRGPLGRDGVADLRRAVGDPPYHPIGPPPFCDRANPPPPGGAFKVGDRAPSNSRERRAAPQAPPTQTAERDAARRLAAEWSMLRNYAAARPTLCREVIPRCNAVLEEFATIMSAEQLLEVASFATICESPPTAHRALQIVIDRFPGTSHAALAEAQQRRLPRQ